MKRNLIMLGAGLFLHFSSHSQAPKDTTRNNLVLPKGYMTSEYGAIPKYTKAGKGKQTLILIPGLGFDASVFSDFMEANKNNYTMYAITIPGYGNTQAPAMPDSATSYGKQTWNTGVIEGIIKLIEKEKLQKPVIIGHFVQGVQVAVKLAANYPDKAGGLILIGGPAKFIAAMNGKIYDLPEKTLIQNVDNYTAPVWFKTLTKDFFDDNNFLPEIYSLDSIHGTVLWNQSASVLLQVAIRYSCEYFALDIKPDFSKIKCPVLILRAIFNDKVLQMPVNTYLKPQFIDSWNDVPAKNSLIQMKDIPGAACFIWKDKPTETYTAIKDFLNTIR